MFNATNLLKQEFVEHNDDTQKVGYVKSKARTRKCVITLRGGTK